MPGLRGDHATVGTVPCDATRYIGPKLLATILFDKCGQHQPLNRQSQRFKCEGIDLSVSTLADQVGAGPNTENAQKLIAFLNRAQIVAGWTQGTGYPRPNTNQVKYLPPELLPLINISPENAPKCVITDASLTGLRRSARMAKPITNASRNGG